MKFRISFLILITISLVSQSFSQNSMSIFGKLNKDNTKNKQSIFGPSFKSLFENNKTSKSIFGDNIIFNQIKDKVSNGKTNIALKSLFGSNKIESTDKVKESLFASNNHEKSLFASNNQQKSLFASNNSSKNQISSNTSNKSDKQIIKKKPKKSPQKSKQKNQTKNKKNSNNKTITRLRNKVTILMQMNEKINSLIKANLKLNKKNKKTGEDLMSFIEQSENKVEKIKEKIKTNQNSLNEKLTDKENEFNKIYESAHTNFNALEAKLENMNKLFDEVKTNQNKIFDDIKEKVFLDKLKILKKLNVDGNAIINGKVNTKGLDVNTIRIEDNNIIFDNENSRLILGSNILHLKELLENIKYVENFSKKCGDDFSNCKIITEKDIKIRQAKDDKILNEIISLTRKLQ
jgi:hypothetical protein